jgi:DNA-binding transcriptional regulator PaaX
MTGIEKAVEGKSTAIRESLAWMAKQGWLNIEKVGNSHIHTLTEVGKAAWRRMGGDGDGGDDGQLQF